MALSRKSDRRRRLLVDASTPLGEAPAAPAEPTSRAQPKGGVSEARAYTIAAERRHQRKTTDLIPKRRLAYLLTVVVFCSALAVINLCAIYATSWESVIGSEGVAALQIWGAGTLASWFATLCWILAAALCLQIFVLRRHRNDDYDGTYRVWGWLTIACLIASLMCTVNVASSVSNIVRYLASMSLTDPAWLPVVIVGMLSSLFAIRVLVEVRGSYGTAAWVTIAWISFNIGTSLSLMHDATAQTAGGTFFGWISISLLTGNAMLLLATSAIMANLTYARYVFLRANGFIRVANKVANEQETLSESNTRATRSKRKKATTKSKGKTEKSTTTKARSTATAKTSSTKTSKAKSKSTAASKPAQTAKSKVKPEPTIAAKTNQSDEPKIIPVSAAKSETNVESADQATSSSSVSASEKLRQLAAASRAKQAAQSQTSATKETPAPTAAERKASAKLSKAERRKLRKKQRQTKRAA
ncbi:MAG: hypothetical protein AAFN77_13430 [Planctomycetota bacterium]